MSARHLVVMAAADGRLSEAEVTLLRAAASLKPAKDLTDEEVIDAVDRLPPNYREVVLLADVEDFTYREIAEVLGVPIGVPRDRIDRGIGGRLAALDVGVVTVHRTAGGEAASAWMASSVC